MSWMRPALLTCLALVFVLTLFYEVDAANAPDGKAHKKAAGLQGGLRRIFMEERDATNFFKRRGRRAVKSQDELNVEQQQRLAADERKREYHEEQRNEFENYAEEEHNGEYGILS
ncbi:hypothetical protein QTP70_005848 [Hemibagrus guttatus]|uniref:Unique cartilage matrix-associated protein n=1 Tax=Hemibagrus guttatus TaxID=175788 RepID=A0AAE0UWR4_9TELE|nr:hypothetical protein QTP70_005848 [Hemibagrus guttatus]